MDIINTIADAAFISFSPFITGMCFCWLRDYHRLIIEGMGVGMYDVIKRELPKYRRSIKVREAGLVVLGLMITAANCFYMYGRPSVLMAGVNMLAALLLLVLVKRDLLYVRYVFLLSLRNHHLERLKQLTQADE